LSVKTLKFEPYPANAKEAKQPRKTWTGSMDIPEDTDVRIEALPSRHPVFTGKVTESFSRNFQVGKYVYKMEKFIAPREDNVPGRSLVTQGEFLVDCTEEQWAQLWQAKPKMVRCVQTSEGPRMVCTAPGCTRKSESRLAAFLHEAREHFGVDPLKDPHKAIEVELAAGKVVRQIASDKQSRLQPSM
jgi:hypothetical protein